MQSHSAANKCKALEQYMVHIQILSFTHCNRGCTRKQKSSIQWGILSMHWCSTTVGTRSGQSCTSLPSVYKRLKKPSTIPLDVRNVYWYPLNWQVLFLIIVLQLMPSYNMKYMKRTSFVFFLHRHFKQLTHHTSLVPRPRPAFRHFQYGKAGTASDGKLGGAWERG